MKTAVIIGATGGIGSVIAKGLATRGWALTLVGRHENKLEELQKSLPGNSPNVPHTLTLDFTQPPTDSEKSLKDIPVDLLVNTAGLHYEGSWELPEEKLKSLFDVNVMGPMRVLQACLPGMIARKSGTVINIASRRGKIATPKEGAYSLSKFALVGMGEALYKELSPLGVKMTTICPGWVHTPMADRAPLPPANMVQAEDILETILYIETLSPAARVKEIIMEPATNIN